MGRRIDLISTDLDGTLFTSKRAPAPQGVQALADAARLGVHVVLNTTRNPEHCRELAKKMGLSSPMVCMNGAQVWASPEGPLWTSHTIPRAAALEIARYADQNGWELSVAVGAVTYMRQRSGEPLVPPSANRRHIATNAEGVVDNPYRILTGRVEAIEGLQALVRQRFSDACFTELYSNPDGSPEGLGIFPIGADKGTALREVIRRLGVAPERVMAIGDNHNDLAMFAVAGISVAMGNARPAIKEKATWVAPSNDEEGVAWAVIEGLKEH